MMRDLPTLFKFKLFVGIYYLDRLATRLQLFDLDTAASLTTQAFISSSVVC